MPNEPKKKRSRRIKHERRKTLRRAAFWSILLLVFFAFCFAAFVVMDHLNSSPNYNAGY
ncbi:hypothetical protein BH10PLA2_BH10PLA2_17160 [soil metagenome]